MYRTILVPTDGSDHSVRAGEHAVALARAFDASIHVVRVLDLRTEAGMFDAGGVGEEYVDRLEERAGEDVETVTDAIGDAESVTTAVVRGDPFESLLEYVAGHEVDLIAMGTHGRTGVERFVSGSLTERVLRHSPAPVLTVRATGRSTVGGGYGEILVPTDGSEPADAAVDHALAVASRTGARIHAVHVVDVSGVSPSPDYTLPSEVLDSLETGGKRATERVAERARDRGLEAVAEVRRGYPARSLLEYAGDNGIDLIVMGTAGRTGPSRFLLGSTTERTVRHAEVPVLAVNAREPDER